MSSNTTQYGFYFDQSRCDGCRACITSCKSWNGIPAGPVRLSRLYQWEEGSFPNVQLFTLFAPCYHCENPVCVDAAQGALIKEPKYGAVLIDPAQRDSPGLKAAFNACPYGAISFDSDSPNSNAYKCTMCVDRLEQGKLPICVQACPMRALDFGKLSDLQAKYGNVADLHGMPSSATTSPAVVFKAQDAPAQVIPLDSNRVLQIMSTRKGNLPDVYSQPSDVTEITPGLMTKNQLKMKASSTAEFTHLLADDNS